MKLNVFYRSDHIHYSLANISDLSKNHSPITVIVHLSCVYNVMLIAHPCLCILFYRQRANDMHLLECHINNLDSILNQILHQNVRIKNTVVSQSCVSYF